MCAGLASYIQAFSTLRTDINRKRWSARTCFRAPHKPFLLLSILGEWRRQTPKRHGIMPPVPLVF